MRRRLRTGDRRSVKLRATFVLFISSLTLTVTTEPSIAAGPTISVPPEPVVVRSSVTVDGSGWDPAAGDVTVSIAGTDSSTTVAVDDVGGFSTTTLSAPSLAGSYQVSACQLCGSVDPFPAAPPVGLTVVPEFGLDPPHAVADSSVTATGNGWEPGIGGSIYVDPGDGFPGTFVIPFTADRTGSFVVEDLQVPASMTPGPHTFLACQSCTSVDAHPVQTFGFEVDAPSTPPTSAASSGTIVPGQEALPGSSSRWPAFVLGILLVALVLGGWYLTHRSHTRPEGRKSDGMERLRLDVREFTPTLELQGNDAPPRKVITFRPITDGGALRVDEEASRR
jgi:hypothetical protein